MTDYKLNTPPDDGISAVKFLPSSANLLLATSWDKTVRLYSASQNVLRGTWHSKAAVLDCAVQDESTAYSGGLDRCVRLINLGRSEDGMTLGTHNGPVSCMEYSRELSALITGGWDGNVHVWDARRGGQAAHVRSLPPSDKVYTLAVTGTKVVVGTSYRNVLIYDTRNLNTPEDRRESSLKHQTRSVRISPDSRGYVLTSVEGRVAVEYFDNASDVQSKRYAFKCHRVGDRVFPVNAVAFHPIHGTFATGGCDGNVYTWDGENKKRVGQFTGYPTSISSLAFNYDGSLLAIASSYTYEEGERDHPPDEIFIRQPLEHEVKKKQR